MYNLNNLIKQSFCLYVCMVQTPLKPSDEQYTNFWLTVMGLKQWQLKRQTSRLTEKTGDQRETFW